MFFSLSLPQESSLIYAGSEIYYTQHTHSLTGEASAKVVKRASDRAVIADGIGDLRSNINDRLYLFVSGSNAAQEFAKTSAVSRSIDSLLSAANGLTTGYQPYVRQSLLQQDSHGLDYRHVGDKQYELKDHLGNVRVVVSDRKNLNTTDGTLSAEVLSYNNYYPFGMLQPGRNFTGEHYRYGFQGQEKDDEVKGEGNAINYKFRLHDPRVGRFFSVDPLAAKYPHNSVYAFSKNRVIDGIELEGAEVLLVGSELTGSALFSKNGGSSLLFDFTKEKVPVYDYRSSSKGVELNISLAWENIVAFYPTMRFYSDAAGYGTIKGISWGEGIVGSVSVIKSGDYYGNAVSLGIGTSLLPIAAFKYETFTKILGPSNNDTAIQILIDNKSQILAGFDRSILSLYEDANFYNMAIGRASSFLEEELKPKLNDSNISEKEKNLFNYRVHIQYEVIGEYRKKLD